jgi:Fe-S cluster assembly protein SufD
MTIHQTTIRPAITPAEQRFLDLYASVSGALPGAKLACVRASRDAALDQFALLGLPHRRVEEWKYTDLRALMPEVQPLGGLGEQRGDISLETAIGKPLAHLDAYRAVFVDGRFRADLSTIQNAPDVGFETLRQVFEGDEASALAVSKLPLRQRDPAGALATAFATDGAIVSIAANAKPGKPIHLIAVASGKRLFALQHAISIGDGAEFSLIETHAGAAGTQAISLTRLSVGARASLNHARSVSGEGAKHLASAAIALAEGATYDPAHIVIEGAVTRYEAGIRFDGPNARCHWAGAMLLSNHAHADYTLVVDHAAPHCESRELMKAVLGGRSRGVFQGKVIVQPGAQKTDGKQMANALLLSDDAEFDSKPELEIFADDVACGHGSTAGQLDQDMLFYIRSRGIPEAEARALLIAAFVGEALDKIGNEAVREALEAKVAAWLGRDAAFNDPAI